jgi:hypothetical protein
VVINELQRRYREDLMIGIADEEPSSWGFAEPLPDDRIQIWDYEHLRSALDLFSLDTGVVGNLDNRLRQAERLAEGGRRDREMQLLDGVAADVDAGVGEFITRDDAERYKQIQRLTTGWTPEA